MHATKGHELPKNLKIYAFAASLGGPGVLTSTKLWPTSRGSRAAT